MTEAWRNFKPGDRLVIARPISDYEKDLIGKGRVYEFIEYTDTHGYARCRDGEYGSILFHPEAIEEASVLNQITGLLVLHLGYAIARERANNIMQVMVLEPDADIGTVAREMLQRYTVPDTVIQDIARVQG